MNTSPSQLEIIQNHLKSGKKTTTLEAFMLCGTMRLPRYIHTLRSQGMRIKDKWIERNDKRWKEYYLN